MASKITGLPADTSPTTDDLVVTVNDPSGTPANKKVDIAHLMTLVPLSAASVDTDEIRNASTYGDLATAGPSVTVTHTGTTAIVWVSSDYYKISTAIVAYIGVDVSGSNTIAAGASAGKELFTWTHSLNADIVMARTMIFTGLTPGTTTFKMQYKADTNNNAHFRNRTIAVFAP